MLRRLALPVARTASSHTRRVLSTAIVEAEPFERLTAADVPQEVEAVVDASTRRIMSMFERYGDSDYIGEPMSITEHSVQTAYAARKAGENDTAVLACLLHDVGHLCGLEAGHAMGMDGCGTPEHERVGAEFLGALGLPQDVAYLCENHVNAKRYLCATQPGYHDTLTEASKTTLRHQGGVMSAAEVASADADPRFPLVLRMRTYDEAGKDPEAPPTHPRDFEEMLRRYCARRCAARSRRSWRSWRRASRARRCARTRSRAGRRATCSPRSSSASGTSRASWSSARRWRRRWRRRSPG